MSNGLTLRKGAKIRGAVEILAGERYCACMEGELYAAIQLGALTYDSVYFGLDRMGYSWNKRDQVWWHRLPEWVQNWHITSAFEEARELGRLEWHDDGVMDAITR